MADSGRIAGGSAAPTFTVGGREPGDKGGAIFTAVLGQQSSPPVFGPVAYPAVSPYWFPRVASFWLVPAAGWPYVIAKADLRSEREYRPVPASASSDKLYADALWLFWDNNFESAPIIWPPPSSNRRATPGCGTTKHCPNANWATTRLPSDPPRMAAIEILAVTDKRLILTALERIQGADRMFLNDLVSGPKAISVGSAAEIVANLGRLIPPR